MFVFLAALPGVRAYHRARAIPDEVSWATLADLGRHVALHRRTHGAVGLDTQAWLTLHFRGALTTWDGCSSSARGSATTTGRSRPPAPLRRGDPVLAVHIPRGRAAPAGRLRHRAGAGAPFAAHFPDEPYRLATCTLLAPRRPAGRVPPRGGQHRPLPAALPPLPDLDREGDAAIVQFVFRRVGVPLDALPRRTALERAVVDHLRAGRHWRIRAGWLPSP